MAFGDEPEKERTPEPLRFEDELKRYLRADPFHDLEIVMTSGDRYEVTDPWQIAMGESAIIVARGKYGIKVLRKSQIVAVHVNESV